MKFRRFLFIIITASILSTSCSDLLYTNKEVKIQKVHIDRKDLENAVFIEGMQAPENICGTEDILYVTCLSGDIIKISGYPIFGTASIIKKHICEVALGINIGPDGNLYAALSYEPIEDWAKKGGGVYRIDPELEKAPVKLTENYPAINGVSFGTDNIIYFTAGNFSFINPDGSVYSLNPVNNATIEEINGSWITNGIQFFNGEMYFSDTMGGILKYNKSVQKADWYYRKAGLVEAIDDFTFDRTGALWMTDPGGATIKMLNNKTQILTKFYISGIGQTSSCLIRKEDNQEVLYITELKQKQNPMNHTYDGRGVLAVTVDTLLSQILLE